MDQVAEEPERRDRGDAGDEGPEGLPAGFAWDQEGDPDREGQGQPPDRELRSEGYADCEARDENRARGGAAEGGVGGRAVADWRSRCRRAFPRLTRSSRRRPPR